MPAPRPTPLARILGRARRVFSELFLIGALVGASVPERAQDNNKIGRVHPVGTVKLNSIIIDRPQDIHDGYRVETLENSNATLEFQNAPSVKLG